MLYTLSFLSSLGFSCWILPKGLPLMYGRFIYRLLGEFIHSIDGMLIGYSCLLVSLIGWLKVRQFMGFQCLIIGMSFLIFLEESRFKFIQILLMWVLWGHSLVLEPFLFAKDLGLVVYVLLFTNLDKLNL